MSRSFIINAGEQPSSDRASALHSIRRFLQHRILYPVLQGAVDFEFY